MSMISPRCRTNRASAAALALGALVVACTTPDGQPLELGQVQQSVLYTECAGYDSMTAANQATWRARCVEDLLTRTSDSAAMYDGVPPKADNRVQYQHGSTLDNYAPRLLAHVNGGAMFPGAMVYGQDGVMGVLDAPLFQTRNTGGQIALSGVSFAPGASSQARATVYSKGAVQDTIARILEDGDARIAPNTYMTLSETSTAKSLTIDARIALSFVLEAFQLTLDGQGQFQRSQETTDLFAQFLQDHYSASAPQPNLAATANFFTADVKPGDFKALGISKDKPMAYVSRVNYGREMYVRFRSHRESQEVKAALSAALDIVGDLSSLLGGNEEDAGAGDGGVPQDPQHLFEQSLSVQTKKTLSETTVTAWQVGGGAPLAGLDALSFIQSMLLSDPTDTSVPLTPTSYVVNHLQTNQVLQTKRVTDFYHVTRGVGRTQKIRLNASMLFRNSGDAAGDGDITGTRYVRGPDGATLWGETWNDRRKVNDGDVFSSGDLIVMANLDSNPSYTFGYDYWDWDRNGFGQWKKKQHIDAAGSVSFNGDRWVAPTTRVLDDDDAQLDGSMGGGIRNYDPCPVGEGWAWTACTKKEFFVDNLAANYGEVCAANPIPVNTDRIFATSSHFEGANEDYTVELQRMTGAYPNVSVDPQEASIPEVTRLDTPKSYMPPNTFVLQHMLERQGRSLRPGAVYRMRIHGNGVGDFGERYFKAKPVGVRSTIDSRQDENMLVPANAPLIVDVLDACGVGGTYRLDLARYRNGSWQTVVSGHELVRDAVTGLSLRTLAAHYNAKIEPGTSWRLTVSVLDLDGVTWRPSYKYVELEACPQGTAWMGDDCYSLSPTWLRSAATQECAFPADVGSGVSYLEPDTCTGDFDFQVVDFGEDQVGLRTSDGRCAQRVDFSQGPLRMDPCTAGQRQTFAQHVFNGFVQLEDDERSCMSFGDAFLTRDACDATNLGNRLQFVWTPASSNTSPSAVASAQSTYPGYSVQKIIDGDRSTALGGASSWANGGYVPDGVPPQWVDLTWSAPRIVSTVDLYTTASYPLQNYDIQVWNGSAFITVGSVRGNTAERVTTHITPQTTSKLRILALLGPNHQTRHTRINELEVY